MNTFKDILNNTPRQNRVAVDEFKPQDDLVRYYNTWWGELTNTHMERVNGGWLITGTRISFTDWFTSVLCSAVHETCILPEPFINFMNKQGLIGFFWKVNGQYAFLITIKPAEVDIPYDGLITKDPVTIKQTPIWSEFVSKL